MSSDHLGSYLATEILTASPQRLRVMLIDGAIRLLSEVKQHWQVKDFALGGEALDRVRAIVNELIAAINRDALPEVTSRLVDLYTHLYTTLVTAELHHDPGMIDDVIRVLSIERGTWKMVCDAMSHAQPPAPHTNRAPPTMPVELVDDYQGGFSIEA